MKKTLVLGLMLSLAVTLVPALAWGPATIDYGDAGTGWQVFDAGPNWWDLTQCDLEISYTIDLSDFQPESTWHCSAVGLGDGALVFMNHCAPYADVTDPNALDKDDKLNLAFTSGDPQCWSEYCYDATGPETIESPPIGDPAESFGLWFDRDGVAEEEMGDWGMIDGATYNTGGVYHVVLNYHAIDDTHGTLFATVNGQQQGFYDSLQDGPPQHWPVGLSFYGNLRSLRVIANIVGDTEIWDLRATGCRYWTPVEIDVKPGIYPNRINLRARWFLGVAVFGSSELDATTIDPSTVYLAGAAPVRWTTWDVDWDGTRDTLFYFKIQDLDLSPDTTEVMLTGSTYAGEPIQGFDSVIVLH